MKKLFVCLTVFTVLVLSLLSYSTVTRHTSSNRQPPKTIYYNRNTTSRGQFPDVTTSSSSSSSSSLSSSNVTTSSSLSTPPTSSSTSTNDIILDDYWMSYLINIEDACTKIDVVVFIPVYSAVTNFRRRQTCRESPQWKYANKKDTSSRLLFFVGIPSPKLDDVRLHQDKLEIESRKYQDIIQMNVVDTYHNLSLKAVGVLKWISKYCSHSTFVLKIDDDGNVEPSSLLLPMFFHKLKNDNFIIGHLAERLKPIRKKENKNYLSELEFPNSTFPPFTFGPAYGYPTSTGLLLYQKALRTKMIYLEDVFLTGICRSLLGIPVFHDINFQKEGLHRDTRPSIFIFS